MTTLVSAYARAVQHSFALLVIVSIVSALGASTDDNSARAAATETAENSSNAVESMPPVTTYWHDWTDSKGVSHLTRCDLRDFVLESLAPPADPEWLNRQESVNRHGNHHCAAAALEGHWHKETKVLWVITLKGTWFIEAMDGKRADLGRAT